MASVEERPPSDTPVVDLPTKVTPSLTQQLQSGNNGDVSKQNGTEETLEIGTLCKNPGCQTAYKSEESNFENCRHHTGQPVFHEGMKFWSCCQKKTSDFGTFLAQTGCTDGKHLWIKKKDETVENKETSCRFDWFQFGNSVVITIYSKLPVPDLCQIKANPVKLEIGITFGPDHKRFEKTINLYAVVDLNKSSVVYSPAKTEITLKKIDFIQWPCLESNE